MVIFTIGSTCAYPPPAAPPFIPKQGPKEGSRKATITFLPNPVKPQGKADGNGSLADSGFCGGDSGDEYQIALFHFLLINQLFGDFGDVAAVVLHFFTMDADAFCNLFYFLKLRTAGHISMSDFIRGCY